MIGVKELTWRLPEHTYTVPDEPYSPPRGACGALVTVKPRAASFKCLGCNYQWRGVSGASCCPRCVHTYIKWTDFKVQGMVKD